MLVCACGERRERRSDVVWCWEWIREFGLLTPESAESAHLLSFDKATTSRVLSFLNTHLLVFILSLNLVLKLTFLPQIL